MTRTNNSTTPLLFDAHAAAKRLAEIEKKYAHPLNEEAVLTLLEGNRHLVFDEKTSAFLMDDAPALQDAHPRAQLRLDSYIESLQTAQATFNPHLFEEHIAQARRLLDDVVELVSASANPSASQYRCVALGISNIHEALAAMNLPAESEEALSWLGRVLALMAQTSYRVGVTLAQERGTAPAFEVSETLCAHLEACFPNAVARSLIESIRSHGLRNGTSIGISPVFEANNVLDAPQIALANCMTKWNDTPTPATLILQAADAVSKDASLWQQVRRLTENGCTVQLAEAVSTKISTEEELPATASQTVVTVRPKELMCDVVRFQNNKEKWVAFVGLLNGRPYEIFTGLQDDEEGIVLPKTVLKGKIIKHTYANAPSRYDFQFENKRGYKTTVEGLNEKFNPEYWNYAKLISGVLRYRMPIAHVIKLVGSLQLKDESINTWKNGVERALKKYAPDESAPHAPVCAACGCEEFTEQEGVSVCKQCGAPQTV